jgi:ferric-dicitrate binding protein FerR (iron transport regulator)
MAGDLPENGHCLRAREWSSLRADGELSELESELLERHLAGCSECAEFEAQLRAVTRTLRTTPAERPRTVLELPRPSRLAIPRQRVLALAAVIMAAGVGALVGSSFQRPTPSAPAPGSGQVSLLSRDLTQLRQLPRARQLVPNPSRSVPGELPEHLI